MIALIRECSKTIYMKNINVSERIDLLFFSKEDLSRTKIILMMRSESRECYRGMFPRGILNTIRRTIIKN